MTPKNISISFAQANIRKFMASVVKEEYGVEWVPRVVRQHKILKLGTLDFIDYAVPCYELAQKTASSPQKVASHIATVLKRTSKTDFKIEAIEGYVNFQLSEAVIRVMLDYSIAWYKAPQIFDDHFKTVKCQVVGLSIANDLGLGTTEKACTYLQQIYTKLGVPTLNEYIVDNYSETTIEPLFRLLLDKYREDEPRLYRDIRDFLSDPKHLSEETEVPKTHKQLCANWLATHNNKREDDNLFFGSDLSDKVHAYLNEYEPEDAIEIIKDEASLAIYYIDKDDALSLRSATGMLYLPAYILYLLDTGFNTHSKKNDSAFIIMGSHRLSLLISSYIRSLVGELKPQKNIVYFDPRVSKADISVLWNMAPSFDNLLSDIRTQLEESEPKHFSKVAHRQALLNLIDLPSELNEFATQLRLPMLFDAVSQAAESLEVIRV